MKSLDRLEDFWNLKNSKKYDSPEKAVEMLKEKGYIGQSYYLIDKKVRDDRGLVFYCLSNQELVIYLDVENGNVLGGDATEVNGKAYYINESGHFRKERATVLKFAFY